MRRGQPTERTHLHVPSRSLALQPPRHHATFQLRAIIVEFCFHFGNYFRAISRAAIFPNVIGRDKRPEEEHVSHAQGLVL